ncbi:MAG: FeoB-associated Cys-rich membrane protein [Atopobiaceae bacterium]|nr:FeoB-associated Cys-rich membrane protein [Atopobiaceae bacterium]
MADVIVIALLVCAVVLAILSIRRNGVSCGGDCASCMSGCASPRLRLTREQERRLKELKKRAEETR